MIRVLVGALIAALSVGVAEAQRLRSSSPVTFYAAPNGVDVGNDCLAEANPCTPQGAHSVALNDWDFAGSSCTVRLADGVYGSTVSIAGQYVGTHLCQVYGHVDQNGACSDRSAVVFDVENKIVFSVQDFMITSIACLTVQGTGGSLGFWGRQHAIIDLADIKCGAI